MFSYKFDCFIELFQELTPHQQHQWGRYDSSALHIQHALRATEVQRKYSKPQERPIESYLVSFIEWIPKVNQIDFETWWQNDRTFQIKIKVSI